MNNQRELVVASYNCRGSLYDKLQEIDWKMSDVNADLFVLLETKLEPADTVPKGWAREAASLSRRRGGIFLH